jgi:anthranilate/para-aminobenzoate synthase component I
MHPLDWTISPEEALAHWPDDVPLAALVTCAPDPAWGRWSMLAAAGETLELHQAPEALAAIRRAGEEGTWCAAISYELGGAFEPTALPRARRPDDGWPLATLVRCDARLEHDHATGRWHATDAAMPLAAMLSERIARGEPAAAGAAVSGLEPDITRADFERMVAEAVELVHAGDIFQANVAQRFSARWKGARRAVMRAAFRAARPRYGAWIEAPGHALASMSPELFLEVDRATGRAVTRPVKGTRPAHEAPGALAASEKDAAELHMIVDLMRNDLGRVAVPGSVRVDLARAIESHETVLHGVAEVSATLRPGTGPAELLQAAFPPGSVTGAPKVRRGGADLPRAHRAQRGHPHDRALGRVAGRRRASLLRRMRHRRRLGAARRVRGKPAQVGRAPAHGTRPQCDCRDSSERTTHSTCDATVRWCPGLKEKSKLMPA